MELQRLRREEYGEIFPHPYHAFNSIAFNAYNAERLGLPLECLAFKTKSFKLGLLGVVRDQVFQSPFSAPFGGFSFLKEDVSLENLEQALQVLQAHYSAQGLQRIELTLPPLFYQPSFLSKFQNVLYRQQFLVTQTNLNHSLHLPATKEAYRESLQPNARKHLNAALSKNFKFLPCSSEAEKEEAYTVIQQNRQERKLPLRMSWSQLLQTSKLLPVDFFLVKLADVSVAAAVVYHLAADIVYVVYWGDLPEYSAHRTMNFLTYQLVNHYLEQGIKIIDVGISTVESQPNYGLCAFKESIGCTYYPKLSFVKNL